MTAGQHLHRWHILVRLPGLRVAVKTAAFDYCLVCLGQALRCVHWGEVDSIYRAWLADELRRADAFFSPRGLGWGLCRAWPVRSDISAAPWQVVFSDPMLKVAVSDTTHPPEYWAARWVAARDCAINGWHAEDMCGVTDDVVLALFLRVAHDIWGVNGAGELGVWFEMLPWRVVDEPGGPDYGMAPAQQPPLPGELRLRELARLAARKDAHR